MERETKNRPGALIGVEQHTTLVGIERGLDKSVNRRGPGVET
jgi:hypothetical protein